VVRPGTPPATWGGAGASADGTPGGLAIAGRIERADVAALTGRALTLARECLADPVVCDVRGVVEPDAAALDALARLQLAVNRLGRRLVLRGACAELRELLELVGLAPVLPCEGGSALEPRRQAEQREQALGVEEEADARDPPA
jgi:ABC-type transporter Mla MlaB component